MMNRGRFPDWFPVSEFAKVSKVLTEKRAPAMYGGELTIVLASILFDRAEAESAPKNTKEVYGFCFKLLRKAKGD
ncbi:MAG: hypothetical protein ACUVQ8_07200 [Nitrososphaeria archaeon]